MGFSELRIWGINAGAVALQYADIDKTLKIILMLVTIGYTVAKWVKVKQEIEDERKDK